ncbi:MAG TPA: hypothetical protein VF937_00465 [Chloroflexota bacterium]
MASTASRMTDPRLAAYEVEDAFEANDLFQRHGWTDGLPIVAPTPERVAEFLRAAGLQTDAEIGVEPVRQRRITAGKLAVNAVMAGCLPAYMPLLVTVVQALCQPEYGLHGATASTGGSAPLIVVNGPVRTLLGMEAQHSVFASVNRANASIGRAVHLVLMNVLGAIPGQLDRSTLGHPGKVTFCIAEDEEDSPWRSLAEERGAPAGASAVTVMACESPHQILNEWTQDPREVLDTVVAAIRANMLTYSIWAGNYALVVPRQLRDVLSRAGWQKRDVREYVYDAARVRRGQWRDVGKAAIAARGDEQRVYTALRAPDDLLVVGAGGPAGGFAAIVPPWYGNRSLAVTRTISPVPSSQPRLT